MGYTLWMHYPDRADIIVRVPPPDYALSALKDYVADLASPGPSVHCYFRTPGVMLSDIHTMDDPSSLHAAFHDSGFFYLQTRLWPPACPPRLDKPSTVIFESHLSC